MTNTNQYSIALRGTIIREDGLNDENVNDIAQELADEHGETVEIVSEMDGYAECEFHAIHPTSR